MSLLTECKVLSILIIILVYLAGLKVQLINAKNINIHMILLQYKNLYSEAGNTSELRSHISLKLTVHGMNEKLYLVD